jgi:hypothetical protein
MATKLGRASRKSIGGDTGEGTGFETVEVDGEWITVARRDLLEEDFEECLDPCFFEQDYTVAASTGFHIWEGCHIMIDQLIRGDLADMVGRPFFSLSKLAVSLSVTVTRHVRHVNGTGMHTCQPLGTESVTDHEARRRPVP